MGWNGMGWGYEYRGCNPTKSCTKKRGEREGGDHALEFSKRVMSPTKATNFSGQLGQEHDALELIIVAIFCLCQGVPAEGYNLDPEDTLISRASMPIARSWLTRGRTETNDFIPIVANGQLADTRWYITLIVSIPGLGSILGCDALKHLRRSLCLQ